MVSAPDILEEEDMFILHIYPVSDLDNDWLIAVVSSESGRTQKDCQLVPVVVERGSGLEQKNAKHGTAR